jgi:ectoine hydroxylase-related dioxygenase (phytanoyl-CoA dioxygenase family)
MMRAVKLADALAELDEKGFAVVPGVLDAAGCDAVRAAVDPHLLDGPAGRNEFEGFATQRVYCLVAKSRAFDPLILDPFVLDVAGSVLGPNFLLTATLAINLQPGQAAQALHYDDAFYTIPRPRPPVSLSVMWAIDPFTADNGATVAYPGSHRWGDPMARDGARSVPLEMEAGSLLLYSGTLIHGGGANHSDRDRLGISIQYATAWARQQENFTLALGVDGARLLPPRLQELIGYSIHPPFMGMIDGRHPRRLLDGTSG